MPATAPNAPPQQLGLFGATMVGISAILGAGIFVLSGAAIRVAGPAAILAFAGNGVIAVLTAFSLAELAAAFPESGGGYVFARKVFPIGGAFATGWVLWLAYLLAATLYALGFGSFLSFALERLAGLLGHPLTLPGWFEVTVAAGSLGLGAWLIYARGAGASTAISVAKIVAFLILVLPGLALFAGAPQGTLKQGLVPLFPLGVGGLFAAMGYTFIAMEGFEVIAAVAEEVRDPQRTIPRAMFLSIGLTLVIYLGLLFVMLTIGGPPGERVAPWEDLGRLGDEAVTVAASRTLGPVGGGVVIVAGLLATFSALSAALLAASRISFSMARDRALPRALSRQGGALRTPTVALWASTALSVVCALLTGSVEVAGAAASLIFLLSFALANAAGLLVRVRGGAGGADRYQAPLYPLLPILGTTICVGLACFQMVVEPRACLLGVVWLGIGGLLYRWRFQSSAQTVSARAEALDSTLVRLRGREPLVLVPLANPERAETLTALANALAPRDVGRVIALTVARAAVDAPAEEGLAAYDRSQEALRRAASTSCALGRPFEAVVVIAPQVVPAVTRVARERRPEVVLLGMSHLDQPGSTALLEGVVARSDADVVVLSAPEQWKPEEVRRVLVPLAGEGRHDPLRARVLGLLQRRALESVRLVRCVSDPSERERAQALLEQVADDLGYGPEACEVVVTGDPAAAIVERAAQADLLLLGLGRGDPGRPLVGDFVRRLAAGVTVPLIAIAHNR